VIFLSLLVSPMVMAAAAVVEHRLGAAAAGWVAALPIGFAVAVLAVSLDAGTGPAGAMALSAASHVPAQIVFALAFAGVLVRRGLLLGAAAGAVGYVACAIALAAVPDALVVACALPALALSPSLMPDARPRPGSRRRWPATALTCAAAAVVVGAAVFTTRFAGPAMAGAVAAFPAVSMTLAVAVVAHDGTSAGAHALAGLVRSLPCYLAFCLVIVLAAPSLGLAATALGLLGCGVAAWATWRAVPVRRLEPRPAA
jgi:hypothetical protein